MAEIHPSAERTLEAIRSAVGDCGGRLQATLAVLVSAPDSTVVKDINAFLEAMVTQINAKEDNR